MFLLGDMFLFKNKNGACSAAMGNSNKIYFHWPLEESSFWLLQIEIFNKIDMYFYWLLNMFAQRRSPIGQKLNALSFLLVALRRNMSPLVQNI